MKAKKAVNTATLGAGLALAGLTTPANAQATPIAIDSITQDGTYTRMNMNISNTTPGTSFTSYELGQNFLTAIWNDSRLVDQSVYSNNFSTFVNTLAPEFFIDTGISDVSAGWSDSTNSATGTTVLTHDPGDKDLDYDGWDFNDTMAGTFRFNTIDGTSFYTSNPGGSSFSMTFLQGSNPFGIGYAGINSYPAGNISIYATGAAVPEPATYATGVGILALLAAGCRRRRMRTLAPEEVSVRNVE